MHASGWLGCNLRAPKPPFTGATIRAAAREVIASAAASGAFCTPAGVETPFRAARGSRQPRGEVNRQRVLDGQGTSFNKLTSQVRHERAVAYLTETDDPIERIAERLGYGETAAFRRAFRRWTGSVPAAFRAQRKKLKRA